MGHYNKRITDDALRKTMTDTLNVRQQLGIPLTDAERSLEAFNWLNKMRKDAQPFIDKRGINDLQKRLDQLKDSTVPALKHDPALDKKIKDYADQVRNYLDCTTQRELSKSANIPVELKGLHSLDAAQKEKALMRYAGQVVREAEAKAGIQQQAQTNLPTTTKQQQAQTRGTNLSAYPTLQPTTTNTFQQQPNQAAQRQQYNKPSSTTPTVQQTNQNPAQGAQLKIVPKKVVVTGVNTQPNNNKPPEGNDSNIQKATKLLTHLLQKNEVFKKLSCNEIMAFYIKAQNFGGLKSRRGNKNRLFSKLSSDIQRQSLDLEITWSNLRSGRNRHGMRTKSMISYVGGTEQLKKIVNSVKKQIDRTK